MHLRNQWSMVWKLIEVKGFILSLIFVLCSETLLENIHSFAQIFIMYLIYAQYNIGSWEYRDRNSQFNEAQEQINIKWWDKDVIKPMPIWVYNLFPPLVPDRARSLWTMAFVSQSGTLWLSTCHPFLDHYQIPLREEWIMSTIKKLLLRNLVASERTPNTSRHVQGHFPTFYLFLILLPHL